MSHSINLLTDLGKEMKEHHESKENTNACKFKG